MKTGNFPGRKNARRIVALASLEDQIIASEQERDIQLKLTKGIVLIVAAEAKERATFLESKLLRLSLCANKLRSRIVEPVVAEASRSKKKRDGSRF